MNKYEGITTISSEEYRELIEDAANYKAFYNELRRDNICLDDKCRELEIELKSVTAECEELRCMSDYYKRELGEVKNELKAYKNLDSRSVETEAANG